MDIQHTCIQGRRSHCYYCTLRYSGIWLAIIFAETEVLMLTAYCLKRYKAKYNY